MNSVQLESILNKSLPYPSNITSYYGDTKPLEPFDKYTTKRFLKTIQGVPDGFTLFQTWLNGITQGHDVQVYIAYKKDVGIFYFSHFSYVNKKDSLNWCDWHELDQG